MPWRPSGFLQISCCSLLAAISALAQSNLSVRGSVVDSSGAIVPNAGLAIQTLDGKILLNTHADASGQFTFTGLPAGEFTLIVPAGAGFAAKSLPLHLTSSVAGIKISLSPDTVVQSVNVGNDQPLSTEAAANNDAIKVGGSDLQKLPVFDQDYIAALTPFLDPSSGSSGGITLIVDGVEMKRTGVSPSAIQEVHINNDPYSTESNRPGRGRIEIITKPGSPEMHGEFNFLLRDASLNAKNYFAPTRPPEQRRIYEGHLTGPIGQSGNSTFIVSGARREEDLAVSVHAITPTGLISQNVQAPTRDSQTSLRGTHDFSAAHRLSVQYNFEYSTIVNGNVGGIVLPDAGVNSDSREDDLVFNDRIIVSPSLLNQLQVTLEKDEDVSHSVTSGVSIQVKDSFISGGAQADISRTENTAHINDIVSWTHGRHYMRFGANLSQLSRRAVDDHTNRLGIFQFASLLDYTADHPYAYTVQQGPGRGLYWINEIGGFFQDQIKLRPTLQLSIGVRYDWQTYLSDNNNFAPRLSVAYAPGKGKTVFRAGSGVFYDRTGGDFPATVKLHNGIVLRSFQVLNPGYPAPLPPGEDIASLPTGLVRFDSHIRTPYTFQYSIGVERQITSQITLTAGYRGATGIKNFRSRDANAPPLPAIVDPNTLYPRPDPSLGFVQQIEAGGRQRLNAFDVSFHGRAGQWFSGQAQYALARLQNNTGGLNFYPQNQYDPAAEWALGDTNRLQRFNLLGNIHPGHWLSLGVSGTLYSGTPYTETAGTDSYQTGLGNARPAGVRRNTLQAGGTADIDLSWDHDFHLDKVKGDKAKLLSVSVDGFNVLNRTNFLSYIGSVQSQFFRQPTAALPGRQLQFTFGYKF